jgi:inositol oxygenase
MPNAFRQYQNAPEHVYDLYAANHAKQTFAFAGAKSEEYAVLNRREMGVWEAMEFLNTFVDQSDPDNDLPQVQHLLQTAERIRRAGHPDWFIVTGLIHDLGKLLYLFGERQWAVVGDTFPVGCAFHESVILHELFEANPDHHDTRYNTRYGVYQPNCGLNTVRMSWGHDEYLYRVVRDYLPDEALAIIRFHSFYSGHQNGAYDHLMNADDHALFRWVRAFQPFDLYSKSDTLVDVDEALPFYEDLLSRFFPDRIPW